MNPLYHGAWGTKGLLWHLKDGRRFEEVWAGCASGVIMWRGRVTSRRAFDDVQSIVLQDLHGLRLVNQIQVKET